MRRIIARRKESVIRMYSEDINFASKLFDIPVQRILAIIMVESNGDKKAVGLANEYGLMQMKRIAFNETLRHFKLSFTFEQMKENARFQIIAGTAYLRLLYNRFNDLDTATRAYNVGQTRLRRNNSLGFNYLNKVLSIERGK